MKRYITAAEADRLRHEATWPISRQFESGCLGVVRGDDYYVVSDDDPRLTDEQRRQVLACRLPAPDPAAGA